MKLSRPDWYWGMPVGEDGRIDTGDPDPDPVKYVDVADDRFYYGRSVFKDGTVIPWCRHFPTTRIGQRLEWMNNRWTVVQRNTVDYRGDKR